MAGGDVEGVRMGANPQKSPIWVMKKRLKKEGFII